MFDVCCHQKEASIVVHQERQGFRVDTRFYLVGHGVQHEHGLVAAISLHEGSFDILGVGDGARLAIASKNDVIEARKEAIQNSIAPGYRPHFAQN